MKADAMANKLKQTVLDSGKKSMHTTVKKAPLSNNKSMAVLGHLILLRSGEATFKIYLITCQILQINNISRTELIASA